MANVIVNGTFNSASGWSYSDRVSIASGVCTFESKGRDGMIFVGQEVTLTPGRTYTVKYKAHQIGRFDTWGTYSYIDSTGQRRTVHGPSLEGRLSGLGYVDLSFEINLPSNARSNRVWVYIYGGASNNGNLTFLNIDNVSLDNLETTSPEIVGPVPTLLKTFSAYNGHTNVAFRSGPGKDYDYVTGVPEGAGMSFSTFTGVGTTDGQRSWLAHLVGNRYVYCSAEFIDVYVPSTGSSAIGRIAKARTGVNLRDLPNASSKSYQVLGTGTRVIVLDTTSVSGWWRVATDNGVGWVSSQYFDYVD